MATTGTTQLANNHYLLGLAYYGKRNFEKATGQFKKAVELNQNHIWAKLMQDANLK